MLSLMRKHAGTWIIKVILGAIVVVFVFWGVGSWTSQRLSRVANVNGDWITTDEYRATYNTLLDQVRQSFGNNVTDELLQSLQLRKRALDQLVDKVLMLQAAEKINLRVSDEELARWIRNIPSFQTAGVFDSRRYQDLLNRIKLTPEAFEIIQRDSLLIEKLRAFITGSIKVSDYEALEWYEWNNSTVSLDYAVIEAKRYTDLAPTDEDLKTYFDEHKESYKTEPQIKVRYLAFKPEAYLSKVTLSEDEIRDYYETNLEDFTSPKTVEARHILLKLSQDASAEDVAAAKEKIENILKMAKEDQDFAELAKQYSEGPTKDKGGYLGTFRKESMVKPFADKAFSMKAGEISEPVRTRFGWHLIKVEKVNPAGTKSFGDAKAEIQKKLQDEYSRAFAYEDAEAAYDLSYEGDSLETIAEQHNLKLVETDSFTRKGPDKGIKNRAQFASAAFDLPENEISDIQDFGDGYYLMQITEKIPSTIPELDTVKEKVKNDWIKAEQNEMARAAANNMLTELKNGLAFEEACEKFGLTPKHTDYFKRTDSIPNIGFEPEISRVAFTLSEAEKLPAEAIKGQKGYFVIRFKGRQAPTADGFDKEKVEIKQRLLQQKKFRTFDAWLVDTRNKARISIAEEFQES
jgi:peptidyl-prolyl cis-trans isomerase D